MMNGIHAYSRLPTRLLEARTAQEREKRAASVFALLLVAAVAIARRVSGLTFDDAPFTLYMAAIAVSAARGGFTPGLVATLASIVAAGLMTETPLGMPVRLVYVAEGLAVAFLISELRYRLRAREARLGAAAATIARLNARDDHARRVDAALRHLEESAEDRAVVVLDWRGAITDWRAGAERLYGYQRKKQIGSSAAALSFDEMTQGELAATLRRALEAGRLRRSAVHRRQDGSRLDVEMEIRPFRNGDALEFTLAVHDLAQGREWDAYRQEATSAQAALQHVADGARQQLAALENLTDPSLNPFGGAEVVTELLERLRVTVRAEGAALVQPGHAGIVVVAANGLQPVGSQSTGESVALSPGRVAVVHNDAARVAQLSRLRWSAEVASLLVVPVVHDGQVWSTIEVVSQRPRRVSDWDVALARVVADRLAAVVAQGRGRATKAS